MPVFDWNFQAHVFINGVDHGIWFIPKGAGDPGFSISEDDFLLPVITDTDHINITIKPQTHWFDIEYQVLALV